MSAFSAGDVEPLDFNAETGSTGAFSPSGSDLVVIAAIGMVQFGTLPNVVECNTGGASGTPIPEVGTPLAWLSGNGELSLYVRAPGPSGSTDVYGEVDGGLLQMVLGGVVYSGLDQTTPIEGVVQNTSSAESVDTAVASVEVTGTTNGQKCGVWFFALADGVNLADFDVDGLSGMTLQSNSSFRDFMGACFVEATASGSSQVLSVNVNADAATNLTWAYKAFRMNEAAGAAAAGSLVSDIRLKSKLRGLVQ